MQPKNLFFSVTFRLHSSCWNDNGDIGDVGVFAAGGLTTAGDSGVEVGVGRGGVRSGKSVVSLFC